MGRGAGCCSCGKSEGSISTYASDERTAEEMGLPPTITVSNKSRSCISSDCPMCLVFIVFWIGMFIIAGIGFDKGDPMRLVYGSDYQGKLCGHSSEPTGWKSAVQTHLQGPEANRFGSQSANWSENTFLWLPVPYDGTDPTSMVNFDAEVALASAVCVKTCPGWINSNWTAQDVINNGQRGLLNKVFSYGTGPNGAVVLDTFEVWYDSHEVYRRCIPSDSSVDISENLKVAVDDIPGVTRVSSFFMEGLRDTEEAYPVVIIAGAMALVFPFIYIILLRCCLKPMVWVMLILMLLLMAVGGYLCYKKYDQLENNNNTEDDGDAKAWLAFAIILWVFAVVYLCFLIWFAKRINAACEIIECAGKVLTSDPSLLLVGFISGITVAILFVWIVYVSLYVYTIEDESKVVLNTATVTNVPGTPLDAIPYFSDDDVATKRNMLYYNLFGWLWTMGVLNAIGFFVVAASTVQYYYSHVNDDEKSLKCARNWLRGYFWAIAYHLGCFITGALLVAIIQFIRFLVHQFTQKFREKSDLAKCVVCIVDCCLACLERFLKYISKNAYIMTALDGSGFWCACCKAIDILFSAISYLAPLILVSDAVFFFGKLMITGAVVFLTWLMLESEDIASEVDNGIFVCVVVGIATWVIASIFFQLYSVCIDSMFLLVFHELEQPKDSAFIFCPEGVFKIITGKDKTEASLVKADFAAKKAAPTEPVA